MKKNPKKLLGEKIGIIQTYPKKIHFYILTKQIQHFGKFYVILDMLMTIYALVWIQ